MDAIECIKTRMSIRKFMPDIVPEETIKNVFEAAKWSPSYKNSQTWEAVVVSGKRKDELSELLIESLESGATPQPDIPEPKAWPPAVDARIKEYIRKRAKATGIDLTDPTVIKRAKAANFRFYGAPHGIFLFHDSSLTPWSILDIGMFAQSLMLAAHAYGLGTVPQAFLVDYAAVIKKYLNIPETKRLVLGLSIGYPDITNQANSFRSARIETGDILRWVE
ncbi:MAG: nitroreductase [Nitrospirae bacterium]|nr:nitroreductase [Nitrospirota bacterium]